MVTLGQALVGDASLHFAPLQRATSYPLHDPVLGDRSRPMPPRRLPEAFPLSFGSLSSPFEPASFRGAR